MEENNKILIEYLKKYDEYKKDKNHFILDQQEIKDILFSAFRNYEGINSIFNPAKYLHNILKKNIINHFENLYNVKKGVNSCIANKMNHIRATDAIIYSKINDQPHYAVIKRGYSPDKGKYAFPGGLIDRINGLEESPLSSSKREAKEETGFIEAINIKDLGIIESNLWDNRCADGATIYGFMYNISPDDILKLHAGDDAKSIKIISEEDLIKSEMAFGHKLWLTRVIALRLAELKKNSKHNYDIIKSLRDKITKIIDIEKDTFFNNLIEQKISNQVRLVFEKRNIYMGEKANLHSDKSELEFDFYHSIQINSINNFIDKIKKEA